MIFAYIYITQLDIKTMKTTIISKNSLRVAAALLFTIMIAAGFTACSNEDNSAETFTPEKVVGKWYYELNQQGTFGEGEEAFEFGKTSNLRQPEC